jgi:CRP/FNR family transcriptional regulator, cyclic AMP receptor protein
MQPHAATQMTLEELVHRLESHALLQGLQPKFLRLLAGYSTETEFQPGQLIFMEGEPANCFYLILDGQVVLETKGEQGEPLALDRVGVGQFIGWSWLLPPYHWHFSARALETTRAVFFYGNWLRKQCEEDPEFGFEMVKRMAAVVVRRLEATQQYIQHPAPLSPEPAKREDPAPVSESTVWMTLLVCLAIILTAGYLLWAKITPGWPFSH